MMRPKNIFQWWVPLISVAILAGMEGWKATLPDASVGAPFLAQVKEHFKDFPHIVGDWEGQDISIPPEAWALLHPNIYISRLYFNHVTGQSVEMLFIEAQDTRDMMGHYPPNCYPGNGWELQSQQAGNWKVGSLAIPGTEYVFKQVDEGREEWLTVRDFFILPNGTMYPDLATFGRAASNFYIRPYGATQIQVIFKREYLPEDRDAIFSSLIHAHMDLINAVKNGVKG